VDGVALEIERKFLVLDDGWRASSVRSERLVDGLLATSKGRKVRVRIYGARATLCVKSRKKGPVRHEFEYEIPVADALHLIEHDCGGDVLVKTRHYVPYAGFTWEVDVYEGRLAGVVIAEVELASERFEPPFPPWIGREVTDDPLFRKSRFRAAGLAAQRSLAA
jgi:CYTH domain-containing protein